MITKEVWEDKLAVDKVKYYNRTRMSIELFSKKVGTAPQVLKRDLQKSGYYYNEATRSFEESRMSMLRKRLCHS